MLVAFCVVLVVALSSGSTSVYVVEAVVTVIIVMGVARRM
jgi:hypothetical protein